MDGFFYSHSIMKCRRGTFCGKWSDPEHRMNFSHEFNIPCDEPLACDMMHDIDHMAFCLPCKGFSCIAFFKPYMYPA